MNKSDSIKELASALSKAQAAIPAAKFDASNPFLKNKYASLGSIFEAARPHLAKNGLSISQHPVNDGGLIGVTTLLMHESGEWIESTLSLPVGDEKGKSSAQVAGSVITYLRRYALASVLGIYADEDTDGNEPVKKAPQPPAKSEPIPAPLFLMTLEMAKSEESMTGEKYGEIPTERLAGMMNSITKVMNQKDLTDEQIVDYQRKLDACRVILAERNKAG